jgi:hypothetical protein
MAITKVGADVTATVVAGTPQDIALPTLLQDDIVIVAATSDGDIDSAGEGVTTAGYTQISGPCGSSPGFLVYWKWMGATPDTTVSFTTDSLNDSFVAIQCWRGVDTTTALDATIAGASGISGMPDPPSYTTVTNDALRIITGHLDDDLPTSIAAPTGYTNLVTLGVNTKATTMMASKISATAGAEDPAAFTGGTPNSDDWQAYHFALRPSSGPSTQNIDGALYTDPDSFFASTLTATYAITGALYSDADTLHSATISASYTISGVRFDDPDTFFTSITTATYAITGGLFTDDDTFFAANISQAGGAQNITGALYSDSDSFFTSVFSTSYAVSGTLYSDGDTFFVSVISSAYNITASLYSDADTFFASSIIQQQFITASLYIDPDTFFAAIIGTGAPVEGTNALRSEFRSSLRLALRTAL